MTGEIEEIEEPDLIDGFFRRTEKDRATAMPVDYSIFD